MPYTSLFPLSQTTKHAPNLDCEDHVPLSYHYCYTGSEPWQDRPDHGGQGQVQAAGALQDGILRPPHHLWGRVHCW